MHKLFNNSISSARFIRRLSHRSSLEGIWLLSIITIKYAADTAFLLLRCQKVTGKDVHGEFVRNIWTEFHSCVKLVLLALLLWTMHKCICLFKIVCVAYTLCPCKWFAFPSYYYYFLSVETRCLILVYNKKIFLLFLLIFVPYRYIFMTALFSVLSSIRQILILALLFLLCFY